MVQPTAGDVTSRYLDTGGTRVHYGHAGHGDEALVLIHGGGPGASSWSNFSSNVPAFEQHFALLLVDLPGYGRSGVAKQDPGTSAFEYYAGVVRDVLDDAGFARAHFIGNSLGGGVSFRFARLFPERTGKLVLLGPAGVCYPVWSPSGRMHSDLGEISADVLRSPSTDTMRAFLKSMVYDGSTVTEDVVEHRLEMLLDMIKEPEPGSPIFEMWLNKDEQRVRFNPLDFESWRFCHEVEAPTLLIWGRDDHWNPVDGALYPLHYMPHAELQVFGRCGHWAQLEQRERFDAAVLEFLGRP